MKKAIFLTAGACFMFGCTTTPTTSEKLAERAKESIYSIDKSIKPECMTPEIQNNIQNALVFIETMNTTCEEQKNSIKQERDRWKNAFLATIVAIIIFAYIKGRIK